MDDISIVNKEYKLNTRVAIVIENEGRYLLENLDGYDYYNLPGGRVKFGETTDIAVVRELNEELGYSCVTSHTYTPSPKQTQLFLSMYPSNSLIVYSFFIMWIKSGSIIIPTVSPTGNLSVDCT